MVTPGASLRRLVDMVSHRSGLALAVMAEATITLPQVLLLSHVERRGATSPTELAEAMHTSLPAVSQMLDRLVQQGLLDRTEDPVDRRRKTVATTADARAFLRKLKAARSTEFDLGLAPVDPELLVEMTGLIERVIAQLETPRPGVRRHSRSPKRNEVKR
jgi:DNA-binding MarR family transcriptional regulator